MLWNSAMVSGFACLVGWTTVGCSSAGAVGCTTIACDAGAGCDAVSVCVAIGFNSVDTDVCVGADCCDDGRSSAGVVWATVG